MTNEATASSAITETAAVEEDATNMWYLAIGSMMLPHSYDNRHFYPQKSHPGELFDFRLGFFSSQGFAEAIPSPGDSLHGVMHRVTAEQMRELDKIEVGYVRRIGKARPYGNGSDGQQELVDVTVYCRPDGTNNNEDDNKPPKERYIGIMIAGAKHFGVDPSYVEYLEKHDFQPRTPPSEFKAFEDPSDKSMEYAQVPASPGVNGELFFSVNGKVLQLSHPPDSLLGTFLKDAQTKYGPHLEVVWSQTFFDAKYGVVKDFKDCTQEHSAYIEDMHYRHTEQHNELQYCKVIGKFSPTSC
ncbi:AIG2-like family [Seminavis robusta]|uniref:AIG2-like family n=1 Tax=Seminavis robusta TaxID=568900 RepID=A0A9N8DBX2_9STRA|nr:AIG2-like family [Seminavis robusta]|eukprot:Sro82_g043820.1 AIG2-like family (299) ;mRNA; f:52616-53512